MKKRKYRKKKKILIGKEVNIYAIPSVKWSLYWKLIDFSP
jgi:hypothetical protein